MHLLAENREIAIDLPDGATVGSALGVIAVQVPEKTRRLIFKKDGSSRVLVLVNLEPAPMDRILTGEDRIFLVMPVPGG